MVCQSSAMDAHSSSGITECVRRPQQLARATAPAHGVHTTTSSSSACDCSGITECAPQLRVTIRRVRLLRHRRVRTTASSSSACDCSGITECAPQLRVTIRGVRLLRHRRVRTAASSSSACDCSGITECTPELRVTIRGSEKTYQKSAISRKPRPHPGSHRSSPGQSVRRLFETTVPS